MVRWSRSRSAGSRYIHVGKVGVLLHRVEPDEIVDPAGTNRPKIFGSFGRPGVDSLPSAQDRDALLCKQGRWHLPRIRSGDPICWAQRDKRSCNDARIVCKPVRMLVFIKSGARSDQRNWACSAPISPSSRWKRAGRSEASREEARSDVLYRCSRMW
jgi:hypothetical protein